MKFARIAAVSDRMNHLARVGESDAVTNAIRNNSGSGTFVSSVPGPVTLKPKEDLKPAG